MTLDYLTLMMLSAVVIIASGVIFVLNTVVGKNDATGRLWSLTFIFSILAVLSLGAWAANPEAWWVLPVANAALVASPGALWSGARSFNARPALVVLPVTAAIGVGVVTALEIAVADEWAGAATSYGAIVLFAALGAVECSRGELRRRVNGRVLMVVLLAAAVYYAARFVVFLLYGSEGEVFTSYFSSEITTLVVTLLVLVASITMSSLRAERGNSLMANGGRATSTFSMGVLEWSAFLMGAGDRVDRVVAQNRSTALFVAQIDNLPEINLAFGRQFGDDAIAGFAALLRAELPPTSIIGYRATGRFAVLSVVSSAEEGRLIVGRVVNALVDSPIDSRGGFRLSASFGTSDSFTVDQVLTHLLGSAEDACDRATQSGGNRVVEGEPRSFR